MSASCACPPVRAALRAPEPLYITNATASRASFWAYVRNRKNRPCSSASEDGSFVYRYHLNDIASITPARLAAGLEQWKCSCILRCFAPILVPPRRPRANGFGNFKIYSYFFYYAINKKIGSRVQKLIGRRLPLRRPVAAGPHHPRPDVHRGGEQNDYPQYPLNCNRFSIGRSAVKIRIRKCLRLDDKNAYQISAALGPPLNVNAVIAGRSFRVDSHFGR